MKRRTKKGWSLVLLLAFVAGMVLPTGAAASDTIYDLTTFRYEVLSDGTARLEALPAPQYQTGTMVIPSKIDGHTVSTLSDSLDYTEAVVDLTIPGTIKRVPNVFDRTSNLRTVVLEDGVTELDAGAFESDTSLASVRLSNALTKIGERAFEFCYPLSTVSLPNGLETIGASAFAHTGLTSLTLPNSVNKVGMQAFAFCRSMKTAVLSSGMTEIPMGMFQNATSLTTVTIPASITSIDSTAFSGCSALTTVYYGGSEAQWQALVADHSSSSELNNATVHCGASTPEPPEGDDTEAIVTPVNLTAASSADGVTLAWDVPLEVDTKWVYDGFDILRKSGSGSYATIAHVGRWTQDYVDATAVHGTTYSYAVRGTNGSETGALSKAATVTYDANAHETVGMNGTRIQLDNQGFGSGQYETVDKLWLTTGSNGMWITLVFDEPLSDENVRVTVTGGGQEFEGTNVEVLAQQLMFRLTLTGGKHLEPSTTYTVRVVDSRGNTLAQTTLESADENTQSWGFTNIDSSYNYADLIRYYPATIADKLYSLDKSHGEDGLCFGMALAAALWKQGDMPSFSGGKDLLNLVRWDDTLGSGQWRGVSVQDYIQACNALQFSQPYASQTRANKNDYDGLVRAVKSGQPVVIGTWIDGTGHAVLAYDYEDKGTEFVIYVQDPQCMPHQICKLTLKGTSGHWSGWSYERRELTTSSDGTDDPNRYFSWRSATTSPDDDFDVDGVLMDIGNNIASNVGDDLEHVWESLVGSSAVTPLSGTSMGWVSDGTLTMRSLRDAVEVIDSTMSLTLAGSAARVNLSGGIQSATVSGSGTLTMTVESEDATLTFEGTAKDGVSLTRDGDQLRLSGAEDGQVTTSGSDGISTSVSVEPGKDYVISLDGGVENPDDGELPFSDVRSSDWFYEPVCYAYDTGIMTGTSATTFAPNLTTTRGMIVAILHRLEGSPSAGSAGFSDVKAGDWYAQAVNWAAANGVVNGIGNGTFAPNAAITREQLAAILRNYAAYKGEDVSTNADISWCWDAFMISDWAEESLAWAVGEGLISGTTMFTIAPRDPATRAQVAAIFQRYLEK